MQPNERRNLVMEKVRRNRKVDIDSLSKELKVSTMTVRRDLVYLEKEGLVIRTHGGAVLSKPLITETPFSQKEGKRIEQKIQVARKAMSFVKEGQTILLDSGTTTLELSKLLRARKNITVITNDIKIAAELIDSELKIIVTGGELQNSIGTLLGPQSHQLLENIHVDVLFLGAHAVDIVAGVTSPTFEKSRVKQLMMNAAAATWLIADTSKLGQRSFSKVCSLDELTGLITDGNICEKTKILYEEHIKVL